VLGLPTDYPRPAVQTFRGARETLILPNPDGRAEVLEPAGGVTLFMLLLAAFKTLLYRYTGQDDILVGTPIANHLRSKPKVWVLHQHSSLRTDFSSNPSFRELLDRVREVTLEPLPIRCPLSSW